MFLQDDLRGLPGDPCDPQLAKLAADAGVTPGEHDEGHQLRTGLTARHTLRQWTAGGFAGAGTAQAMLPVFGDQRPDLGQFRIRLSRAEPPSSLFGRRLALACRSGS